MMVGMTNCIPTSSTEAAHQRRMASAYSGLMARRLRSFSGALGRLGSPLVLNTKMLSGPISSKKVTTPARRPVSSEATVTTVVMPMTMPRMVSSERNW